MAKNGKPQPKNELDKAIDGLFQTPLAEFINERNALASRLKKEGRASDATLVKTLTKPAVSAWAVNQLFWQHREELDELLAAAQRLRKLQSSGLSGKTADMRAALDSRRDALAQLSELASELLSEAGHSPTPDTLHRITTTLDAVSSNFENSNVGRLTQDIGPLGFDSLAAMMAGGLSTLREERTKSVKKSEEPKVVVKKPSAVDVEKARKLEESRQVKIAAAKSALQLAKKTLVDARAQVQSLEVTQKKLSAKVKEAEKQKREAEVQFKKASFIYEEAAQRARDVGEEIAAAKDSAEEARRAVERESKELEKLFGEK